VQRYIITIEGPGFTDVEETELLELPVQGDTIDTKYGTCIVTGTEILPADRQYAGRISCRMP
jgi:hypothetical protein